MDEDIRQGFVACNRPIEIKESLMCAYEESNGTICHTPTHLALITDDVREKRLMVILPLCAKHIAAWKSENADQRHCFIKSCQRKTTIYIYEKGRSMPICEEHLRQHRPIRYPVNPEG